MRGLVDLSRMIAAPARAASALAQHSARSLGVSNCSGAALAVVGTLSFIESCLDLRLRHPGAQACRVGLSHETFDAFQLATAGPSISGRSAADQLMQRVWC